MTLHMLHESFHAPYKNVQTSSRIKPNKIIGAKEFCWSVQVSNSDDDIYVHMNYDIKYQR